MRAISLAGCAAAIVEAMKTKKNLIRGVIALAVAGVGAGVVATSAMATTATATTPASHRSDGGYGFTAVRSGIPDSAARFSVTSPEVHNGGSFSASEFANAFGCSGGNEQFTLDWTGAPSDAKSYAVTMFDPDAPTGSGFWHWLVWDIPAKSTELTSTLPSGAVAGTDSAGITGYLGPCPPIGDITHHYKITVYALDVASLDLPSSTPAQVTTFTMSGHIIGYAQMTVNAKR
jgi:Raf kinase inhibitor-like YbhB/YbcL family protein